MFGIFARVWRLIRAAINAVLGKAENHNPQMLLNQAVDDMQTQMNACKREVAEAIAEEKKLAKKMREEQDAANEWLKRAQLAVAKGNDALAKEALARKKEHENQGISLQKIWEKQRDACENLKVQLRGFNNKIEEAKRKKGVLIARHEAAQAQKQIAEAQSSFSNTGAFATFEQMEGRITEIEANAEATYELSEEYSGDNLSKQFLELEAASDADDLAALKVSMGMAPPPALEAPKARVLDVTDDDALIEAEFEALQAEERKQTV